MTSESYIEVVPPVTTRRASKRAGRPSVGSVQHAGTNDRGLDVWRVRYTVGYDAQGRQVRRSETVVGTKSDAERRRSELVAAHGAPRKHLDRPTVAQLVDGYLAAMAPKWKGTTALANEALSARLGWLGDLVADEVTAEQVEAWLAELRASPRRDRRKGPLAPSTVRRYYVVLKAAFAWGAARKLVRTNPAIERVPTGKVKRAGAAKTAAQKLMIHARETGGLLHGLVAVLAVTGCRVGEACALDWSRVLPCVDGGAVLRIDRTITKDALGAYVVGEQTKTGSERDVAVGPEVYAALLALGTDTGPEAFVFQGKGRSVPFLRPDNASALLVRAYRACGVERSWSPAHGLRHLVASTLANNPGVAPSVVIERMGWSGYGMFKTYVDQDIDADRAATRLLEDLLG